METQKNESKTNNLEIKDIEPISFELSDDVVEQIKGGTQAKFVACNAAFTACNAAFST